MDELKIICPNCKSLLKLQNTSGVSNKMLTCPICRFRAKVSVFQQTNINKSISDKESEPTQVNFEVIDRTIGSLFFQSEEYSLHKGVNTIGRKAKTSHAEVQISEDKYMSRQHAIITVKEGKNGFEHLLQPTNPKNPIKINGRYIENDDVIFLQWGDRLTFGHTELIFEHPHYYDEETAFEE